MQGRPQQWIGDPVGELQATPWRDPLEVHHYLLRELTGWCDLVDDCVTDAAQCLATINDCAYLAARDPSWLKRREWTAKREQVVQEHVATQHRHVQSVQGALQMAAQLLDLTRARTNDPNAQQFHSPDVLPIVACDLVLPPDETPHANEFAARVNARKGDATPGTLVITSRRVFFVASTGVQDMPLSSILRVTWSIEWPERPSVTLTARSGMHTYLVRDAIRIADLLQALIRLQHRPAALRALPSVPQGFQPAAYVGTPMQPSAYALNLMHLDPLDFERLVADLFTAMGLETHLTKASHDGGIDCIAYDRRPIIGGEIVIQAKRYTHTVGVSVVRDLFGAMQDRRASKGIVVTTSGFGPDAYKFVADKPLELIDGKKLMGLLREHMGVYTVTGLY